MSLINKNRIISIIATIVSFTIGIIIALIIYFILLEIQTKLAQGITITLLTATILFTIFALLRPIYDRRSNNINNY